MHKPCKAGKLLIKLGKESVPHFFGIDIKIGIDLRKTSLDLGKLVAAKIKDLGVVLLCAAGRIKEGQVCKCVTEFYIRIELFKTLEPFGILPVYCAVCRL